MQIYAFVDFCHVLSNANPKSMSAQGVTPSFTQSIGSDLRRESGQIDFVPTRKSKWPMKCEVDLLFVISHRDKWKAPPPLLCLLAFCQHYKLQIGISWKAKQITTDLSNSKGNHGRTMKRITILVMDSLDCWAKKWEQKQLCKPLTSPIPWYSEQISKQSHSEQLYLSTSTQITLSWCS